MASNLLPAEDAFILEQQLRAVALAPRLQQDPTGQPCAHGARAPRTCTLRLPREHAGDLRLLIAGLVDRPQALSGSRELRLERKRARMDRASRG
eukprot:8412156-Pyramimonas_sp.AAC.1